MSPGRPVTQITKMEAAHERIAGFTQREDDMRRRITSKYNGALSSHLILFIVYTFIMGSISFLYTPSFWAKAIYLLAIGHLGLIHLSAVGQFKWETAGVDRWIIAQMREELAARQ